MRRKSIFATLAVIAFVVVGAYIACRLLTLDLVFAHQQAITREIATWGETYSNIQGPDDAGRASKMVEYIRNYYPVGPGYRSDPQTEAALENQRRETIEQINTALQKYKESSASRD